MNNAIRIYILFLMLWCRAVYPQHFMSASRKIVLPGTDSVLLDSMMVISRSPRVFDKTETSALHDSLWRYNPLNQTLYFKKKITDTFLIQYHRYPLLFKKPYFILDSVPFHAEKNYSSPFAQNYPQVLIPRPGEYLMAGSSESLVKNGSISRGITVGNNQNASLQSQLNLQVFGKIAEDIEIEMAATDNSIPFQPDGTTAQLQEFDRVYITARTPFVRLTAGDFQSRNSEKNYFLKYFKRLQGIQAENTYRDSAHKWTLFSKASFAVSRGKFSRMVFYGQENNQGPYRLKGAGGELFIVVLSGTERVYVDGELLERGQDKHYIIDYNASEIIFTARTPITKDKRIVIEFQYTERNYARSLWEWQEEIRFKKASVFFSWLSEQDNPNRTLQQTLTSEQKQLLFMVGDTLGKAFSPSYFPTSFDADEILYIRKDTLVQSVLYKRIFQYKPDFSDKDTFYRVTFSFVGAGKGNYVRDASKANGRVFRWVVPVNGKPSGDFEPVIMLVSPKKNALLNAGITYSISRQQTLNIQGALSENNVNRFSPYNRENDRGMAASAQWNTFFPVNKEKKSGLMMLASTEWVSRHFTPYERFRSVEFERDWNRPLDAKILSEQQYYQTLVGWKDPSWTLSTQGEYFSEAGKYQGRKAGLNLDIRKQYFTFFHQNRYLESRDTIRSNFFFRHRSDAAVRIIKNWQIGYKDEYEQNIFSLPSDKASAGMNFSYRFYQWEPYLEWNDSLNIRVRLFYRQRTDQRLQPRTYDSVFSVQTGGELRIRKWEDHPLFLSVQYREIKNKNKLLFSIPDQHGFFNRLEYQPRLWRGFVQAGIFAETGYGLENRKEFYYMEVTPGQGQFAWIDYNSDGIKQLNEFEPARYPDQARFIRVFIPTQDFIRILKNQLDVNLTIRPSSLIKEQSSYLKKFLSRWQWQSIYRAQWSYLPYDNKSSFLNAASLPDSLLQAANGRLRLNTFFNQGHPVFGSEYTYQKQQNRQLVNFSMDDLSEEFHELKIRWTLKRIFTVFLEGKTGVKNNTSKIFITRNYFISYRESELRLQVQPGTDFRVSVSGRYSQKINRIDLPEQADIQEYAAECRYNFKQNGSIQTRLSWVNNRFRGNENSTAAFEMLNALQKGQNWVWELGFQQNLTKNMQANVFYQGRKNVVWIHTGTVEVRAFF